MLELFSDKNMNSSVNKSKNQLMLSAEEIQNNICFIQGAADGIDFL